MYNKLDILEIAMQLVKKIAVPLLLLVLLSFAFLLRSKMFFYGDFYYLVDQSRDLLLAQSLVLDHKLTLIGPRTGIGGIFHGPLWIYMIAPFFAIANGNPFWTLVPLFMLVSLSIVAVGFFVGARLYNKWVGLLFALLLAISAPLVQTVPFTTNAQVTPLIFLFYLFSIIQFLRGKEIYFIFALFFTGLGFQFESAFAVLWIPLTLLAIMFRKKIPHVKNIVFGICAFFFAVGTFILFDVRHQFLMTSAAIKLFFTPTKPLPGYEQYADIAFRFNDRVISLWNSLFTPLFLKETATTYLLLLIIVLGIGFLVKKLISHKKKLTMIDKEYLFILLSPLVIYGIYIIYPLPLWEHYLLPISILSVFVLALSIYRLFVQGTGFKILIGVFLLLTTTPAFIWTKATYLDSPSYIQASDGSYKNQREVATWVLNDANNKEYGYFVYTTGILTYNMDYLLSWLSRENNVIKPSNLKHQTTYLIMYPHSANDKDAYAFWKKNVVRTKGKVVQTKIFTSGITVEKLAIPKDDPAPDPNYYQDVLFR